MDLRKVLRRFTKQQLLDSVWQTLHVGNIEKPDIQHSTKEEMVSYILKVIKDLAIDVKRLILSLELKYCQIQANRKQWSAAEIKNPKILVKTETDPEKFAQKLDKYLNRSQLFCEVVSEFLNDVMWTVVSIKPLKSKSNMFFLLTYVDLPICLHSYVKPNLEDIICRSLVELFNGTSCEKHLLKSKNIDTLLLCVSKKLTAVENLQQKLPVERRRKLDIEKAVALPNNIINEDCHEELERKLYLENTFGNFEQPVFQSLTYNVSAPLHILGGMNEKQLTDVKCRAVIKGDNVLEGLRELVEDNIADIPLPEYMTNIVHYGTDRITVNFSSI